MVRSFIVLSAFVLALSSLVGCASRANTAVVPSSNVATETVIDEAWTPNGEMEMSFKESRTTGNRANASAASFKPNVQERPTRGAVHAATN